jgi:hypothetical protein
MGSAFVKQALLEAQFQGMSVDVMLQSRSFGMEEYHLVVSAVLV